LWQQAVRPCGQTGQVFDFQVSSRTTAEFLAWGLDTAVKELSVRPERLKVLLVIHDGEPVYRTRAESDWNLSQECLSRMERSGITPIGVYIGPESGCSRLKLLFRRLVVCEGRELPEKLGSLLQSLA
jgi:nitric oxide reductase activation protein